MKKVFAIASILFAGLLWRCSYLPPDKANIDIFINPEVTGWYFIELVKDSSDLPTNTEVRFDSAQTVPKVPALDFAKYNFRVFTADRQKISGKIKAPAFVYHTIGRTFYRFYNPTPQELADEANWNPKGPVLEQLRNQSIVELNKLMK